MKASSTGKRYWRSLSELENSPEFEEFLQREFPVAAAEFPDGISRRRWLQLMAASLAFGGLAGCRYREEKIVPLAKRPEDWVPGKPQRYATSIELAGATRHLLVTCYDGRPIKVEGNPDHPYSLGATDMYSQACVLDLYDPDRCGDVRQRDQGQAFTKTWDDFAAFAAKHFQALEGPGRRRAVRAAGADRIGRSSRAAVGAQGGFSQSGIVQLRSADPRQRTPRGSELAFGKAVRTHLALDKAQIIVCLDADLLGDHPASLRLARQFADGRDVAEAADPKSSRMNRLYVAESQYSTTGAMADHRLAVRSTDIAALVADLEKRVRAMLDAGKVQNPAAGRISPGSHSAGDGSRLVRASGAGVIAVGPRQPAEVHAQVHRLNALLDNAGKTVTYTDEPAAGYAAPCGDLADLAKRMQAGSVKTLVMLGGNPVYDAPADLEFEQALAKVGTAIHLSSHENETSQHCQWLLPQTHPFETWGDCRAVDGTICVTQPLIETLLGGKSALELLALLLGDKSDAQTLVRRSVDRVAGRTLSDKEWRKLLHDGFLADSGLKPVPVELKELAAAEAKPAADGELELVFCRSETVYDGRFANNGWLQETPHLVTKLTWDNAALVSPATAKKLGVQIGSDGAIGTRRPQSGDPRVHPAGAGRRFDRRGVGIRPHVGGMVGGSAQRGIAPVGVNVTPLRTTAAMHVAAGVKVTPHRRPAPIRADPRPSRHRHGRPGGDRPPRGRTDPRRHARAVPGGPALRPARQPPTGVAVAGGVLRRQACLGHVDRLDQVHRLQRLRGRLPGREQRAGRGQGPGGTGPRNALDPHRPLLPRQRRGGRGPAGRPPAGGVPAVRERPVRAGLPGGGDRAQPRRAERHGLQPLHRHAVLRQQLPVQGAAVQLLQLPRRTWRTRIGS